MSDVGYWDAEARDDPRYAAGCWGMTADADGPATVQAIVEIVQDALPHSRARVLEIGCGPARLLLPLALANPDAEFAGLDISPEMLSIAKRRIRAARVGNISVTLDGRHLAKASFDVVYCVELMQHLDDDWARAVVGAAYAMLRPGGLFISQWVTAGAPGPHSFPRSWLDAAATLRDAGFDAVRWASGHIHPDWAWAYAGKQ